MTDCDAVSGHASDIPDSSHDSDSQRSLVSSGCFRPASAKKQSVTPIALQEQVPNLPAEPEPLWEAADDLSVEEQKPET